MILTENPNAWHIVRVTLMTSENDRSDGKSDTHVRVNKAHQSVNV